MVLNAVYCTFQGEVNPWGIGAPVIFIRLSGCHLRCYDKTLGTLCDTPEALSRKGQKETTPYEICQQAVELSESTGIKLVTLTGGDPLWNKEEELKELFSLLTTYGFFVCVETSGTISWLPYVTISESIFFILDYKLKSTGVKFAGALFEDETHLKSLTNQDYIKFVVYDTEDLEQAIPLIEYLFKNTQAVIAVGSFWGGKLPTFQLYNACRTKGLLGKIVLNMQTHKMAVSSDYTVKIPEKI